MFFLRHSSSSLMAGIYVFFILATGLIINLFHSKMETQSDELRVKKLIHTIKKVQSVENLLQHNVDLQKFMRDLINDEFDTYIVLKRIEVFEKQNGNKVNVNDDKGIIIDKHISNSSDRVPCIPKEPSVEYEKMRRRIRFNALEMWNFYRSELEHIKYNVKDNTTQLVNEIEVIQKLGVEHKRSLIADIDNLKQLDGYEQWRQKEARELNELVQRRLTFLQNPKDCKSARRLLCHFDVECGLGCILHHILDCLNKSYAENRTMVSVNSKKWIYHSEGWEAVFKPISNTCEHMNESRVHNETENQVIEFPFHEVFAVHPPYFPKAIPEDLALRLIRLDEEPSSLWIGYFIKYIMQIEQSTYNLLNFGVEKIGWKRPIVGVHIRRTDKHLEAEFHSIEEYMVHVEDYYLTLELNGTKQQRRIYLATDELAVIEEAREKFPHYEILCNTEAARLAHPNSRYSKDSLYGLLLDIRLISMSDFVVGTLSSTFFRIIYELMHTMYLDVAHRFKSLDDIYYYAGQKPHRRRAVIRHEALRAGEIDMEIGDELYIAGNYWNGYCKGHNLRSLKEGLFPTFKTVAIHHPIKMPTYPEA